MTSRDNFEQKAVLLGFDITLTPANTYVSPETNAAFCLYASRDAEVAELTKKINLPMKYKRMEFNAHLQAEVAALTAERNEYGAEGLRLAGELAKAINQRNELAKRNSVLLETIREARHALQMANDSPGGAIRDTIWMLGMPETLFDFMDAAIETQDSSGLMVCKAEPDGYFYTDLCGNKGYFIGTLHDRTKSLVESGDMKITPFWLLAKENE